MFFNMKVFRSSVIVILLAVGFQSKNAVCSEGDTPDPNEQPQNENPTVEPSVQDTTSAPQTSTTLPSDETTITLTPQTPFSLPADESTTIGTTSPLTKETLASPFNIEQPSAEPTTSSTNQVPLTTEQNYHNADDLLSIIIDSEETVATSPKVEITEDHQSLRSADSPSSDKKQKSVVEIIESTSYNNFHVVTNLLNFSYDKDEISHIGEPFELRFIEDLQFSRQSIEFHGKISNFSNIRVNGASIGSVDTFYNNFSCASQRNRILLNVVPENMTFEGDYIVQDINQTNKISNGSFLFNQTGAKLSYEFPDISVLHRNSHNLTTYGDIIYANGQVKFTQLCDNQCDLLATSALMFDQVKSYILEKVNSVLISKKSDQFVSAFPFLSICSSSTRPKSDYYVIKENVTKTYKSSNLLLGPMILKGLDNFTFGNVIAVKSTQRHAPTRFVLSTRANHIQGQCDWHYFKGNSRDSNNKHSFTFIIEEVKFFIRVNFSEAWNVDDLEIHLGKISVHRLNKNHPKMLDFVKSVLEDFVREATIDSLKELFRDKFPELIASTSTSTEAITTITTTEIYEYTKKTKPTETRQVVYWTTLRRWNRNDETVDDKQHLPFPTRKVLTPCKDTRKWWQKIFYRNPCKNVSNRDDDQ